MTCHACTRARSSICGEYVRGCFGCQMRAAARGMLAQEAVRDRSTKALREWLATAHPNVTPEVALQAIWDWWAVDHPKAEAA